MWKRDEAAKPGGQSQPQTAPAPVPVTPAATPVAAEAARPITSVDTPRGLEKTVNIGKSVIIKGELNGSEDLTIEGQVEGKIELRQNVLTIGPNGKIKAQVFAKSVIILGEVTGNVTATEKVDIRDNGSVDGDIAAPRVAIAEGAHFRGSIDMQRAGGKPGEKSGENKGGGESKQAEAKAEQKPAQAPAAAAAQPTPAGASR
jgi:cytoskeletal protein CcmA (bactofilin family)